MTHAEMIGLLARRQDERARAIVEGAPITAEILTHDAAWIAKHGRPGRAGRTAITITRYEQTTFGTRRTPMVRFDIGPDMPCDWGNRLAMIPRDHTSLASAA